MADNPLKRVGKAVTNHFLEFAKQTALGGPKYFANRGTIDGGTDVKTSDVRASSFRASGGLEPGFF